MRIVFAGTPEVAVPTLQALAQAAGIEIVGVITREDAPVGRKRVLTPSPVAEAAAALGVETYKANNLDAAVTEWVAGLDADLGVIVAYGVLVRQALLDTPKHGWINLHFSRLPAWRGAAPVQRALMAGETEIGYSVFQLVSELDAGDVYLTDTQAFEVGATADDVLAALAVTGAQQIVDAVRGIGGGALTATPQQGEASYAHKLTRADGKLDFTQSAEQVFAHWTGVTSEPGAWAELGDGVLKFHGMRSVSASDAGITLNPGEVKLHAKRVYVGTGSTPLELVIVQPAGKGAMPAADWLRGRGGEAELR